MNDENIIRKIESYPDEAKKYAYLIRSLIYETAKQEEIPEIEETLKWGEPSFKAPHGTAIRMDWKENTPQKFYIFFNCKTIMIDTCRVIHRSELVFEGNRAIILDIHEEMPKQILKHCFSLALKYHKLKKNPLLGA